VSGLAQLPGFLQRQRWYAGKARRLRSADFEDAGALGYTLLALVRTRYSDGRAERYFVPLSYPSRELSDAGTSPAFGGALLAFLRSGGSLKTRFGSIRAFKLRELRHLPCEPLQREQSNTSFVYGGKLILKLFRRPSFEPNPELELGRWLTERKFAGTPALAGWLEYRRGSQTMTLGVLQELVRGGWDFCCLSRKLLKSRSKEYPKLAARLGRETADLHRALSGLGSRTLGRLDLLAMRRSMRAMARKALALHPAKKVVSREREILACFDALLSLKDAGKAIRCHGDLHLGQVLHTKERFYFIDFEGEPMRSPAERSMRRTPLYDVAGMLRSFDYAASAMKRSPKAAQDAYLDAYLSRMKGTGLLPKDPRPLLKTLMMEKALYELDYELNNRPSWANIPAEGILRVLDSSSRL